MNWDAMGAIGEVLGAMAVVLTLFYLARQVHQNSEALDRDRDEAVMNRWSEVRSKLLDDPELAQIWLTGHRDHSGLTDVENVRFWIFYSQLTSWMSSYYARPSVNPDRMADFTADIVAYWRLMPSGEYWWNRQRSSLNVDYASAIESRMERLRQGQPLSTDPKLLWLAPSDLDEIRALLTRSEGTAG